MLERISIEGLHTDVDNDLRKYVQRKIGKLDKYLPRGMRQAVYAEVILKEQKIRERKDCTCEVILRLPHEVLNAKETTINMYAAIDIAEAKLTTQLKKYKNKRDKGHQSRTRKSVLKWMKRP